MPRVVTLGVTGGIGSGKSVRCGHLLRLAQARARQSIHSFAAHIITGDKVGHDIYSPGKPCYYDIIGAFGKDILQDKEKNTLTVTSSSSPSEPYIDRRKLGARVFEEFHSKELQQLNNICWSHIHDAVEQEIEVASNKALANKKAVLLIIMEAALLLESSLLSLCDDVWITTCDKRVAVERVMKRDHLTEQQATARVEAQGSLDKKLEFLKNIKFKGEVVTFNTTCESLEEGLKRVTMAFDEYWLRKLQPLLNNPDAEMGSW
ncbi:dephospho-CoA kinase [Trypanosoma rangeli]|uniref:Dephospho-CoA kinase n=1 Tax=Trypanosoma rangeli TaxID=5698 RepID=A0A3R7MR11_TRYRA|nr:dephospho-CoA kinase [Trypanosoma rangeli]RNF09865.1 dephospho-CoA kinase [Trypanosoma rangeli]|eukprot:RNF09865.1 dephospho-CoA kinase [Trypanosoma rangeli]